MGIASSISSAFPCGIPSTTSTRTRSASSRSASQWAVVAPVMPAPMIEILFMTPPEIYGYRSHPASPDVLQLLQERFTVCVWRSMRSVVHYSEILSETELRRKYILSLFILPDLAKKTVAPAAPLYNPSIPFDGEENSGGCDWCCFRRFQVARRLDRGRGAHACRGDHLSEVRIGRLSCGKNAR